MIGLTGTTTGYGANAAELAKLGIRLGNSAVPTNGLYSPGADQLAISTAGTGRLFVASDGKVGIGTDTPEQLLQLSSVTPILSLRESDQATDEKTFDFRVNSKEFSVRTVNDGYTAARQAIAITRSTGIDIDHIRFSTGAGTERARIDSSGRLLVGTSTAPANYSVCVKTSSTGYNLLLHRPDAPGVGNDLGILGFSDNLGNTGAFVSAQRDGGTWTSGSSSPGRLVFSTTADGAASPTERMVIKSDGKVGIGTSSPGQALDVVGAINSQGNASTVVHFQAQDTGAATDEKTWRIAQTNRTNKTLLLGVSVNDAANTAYTPITITRSGTSLDNIQFATGTGTERVRIDSSGRLLVGTSADITGAAVQTAATTGDASSVSAARFGANANPGYLSVFRSRGATVGTHAALTADDGVGAIYFFGSDGAAYRQAAAITAFVDGGVASADMPGRLVFSTTADGASSPTERMRIGNSGRVMIGTTGGSASRLEIAGPETIATFINTSVSDATYRGTLLFTDGGGSPVGGISVNTTSTQYSTTSDYRLKENVVTVTDGITRLQQLKPSRFNFIAEPNRTVDGFIAHEVQAVVPEAVNGVKDELDKDGKPKYQGIDQSKLVPLLTAALQEAVAKIQSLEARITAAGF